MKVIEANCLTLTKHYEIKQMEKEVEVEMSTGLTKRWILKALFVRAMKPAESILNLVMN